MLSDPCFEPDQQFTGQLRMIHAGHGDALMDIDQLFRDRAQQKRDMRSLKRLKVRLRTYRRLIQEMGGYRPWYQPLAPTARP